MQWLGYSCNLFNVGNYRRAICGAKMSSDFFDPNNKESAKARDQCATQACEEMY